MNLDEPSIVVCPSCHYGFRDSGGPGLEFVCPQTECGHRWEAIGQTIRAVQGTQRRRGIVELAVVADGAAVQVPLSPGETVIGREAGCGFVLDNLSVSRRHARISVDAEGGEIEDLASSCGTAVNGVFITETQRLFPGDEVILGGTTLRFDVPIRSYRSVEADRGPSAADQSRCEYCHAVPR